MVGSKLPAELNALWLRFDEVGIAVFHWLRTL
jgi:hypothetical protein